MKDPMEYAAPSDKETPRFVMDLEGAKSFLRDLEAYPLRKRICICGHPVQAHHFNSANGYDCKPGRIWCLCTKPEPVFCASDARLFQRATKGVGYKHALGTGIAALTEKGGSGEWMVQLSCEVRGCEEKEITVACMTEDNRVSAKPTKHSRFICHKHAWDLGGWML